MKTLIIHPKDSSTTFLDGIYADIEDKTVIQGGVHQDELKVLIEQHDRVMMMGHGSPSGLFSVGMFPDSLGHIIDASFVPLLSQKDNSVFIWCNADKFVNLYHLRGFYSGMFISEVREAKFCNVEVDQKVVTESNYAFSEILSGVINTDAMYNDVMVKYGQLAETNPVAKYNADRLYLSEGELDSKELDSQRQSVARWQRRRVKPMRRNSLFDLI
jgi:hypothetical protein